MIYDATNWVHLDDDDNTEWYYDKVNKKVISTSNLNDEQREFMGMKKFARKCEVCEKLFNEGYCIDSGESYYCSQKCLNKEITDKEFLEMFDEGKGDSYWTSWEDEDEFSFWEDGSEIDE